MPLLMLDGITVDDFQMQLVSSIDTEQGGTKNSPRESSPDFYFVADMVTAESAHTVVTRTYYDTFDWRLYHAGSIVEETSDSQNRLVVWQPLDRDHAFEECTVDQFPRFAWEFPAGIMRDQLTPIIEMRALLPLVHVQSDSSTLRVLNEDQKTVARLVCTRHSLVDQARQLYKPFVNTIQIISLKGYAKAATRLQRQLQDDFGLLPMSPHLALQALAAADRQPGDYTSKPLVPLTLSMRADEATKTILLQLLESMMQNEPGLRADLDSEFLHDFRVAVRRTRSALTQIKGVLPNDLLNHYRDEFRWLGQITGLMRDLDVYLLKFDNYQAELPPDIRTDLMPLRDFLITHQTQEQRRLVRELDSPRYHNLLRDWRSALETATLPTVDGGGQEPPNAARPIIEVANTRIWRIYRRAHKEGSAITAETPASALHELRITCKKLRYLMEFFQSLYPPREIKSLITVLKDLQNNLGDFQDYEVQAIKLREFAQQMMDEGKTPAVTLMAMGILVEHLVESQAEARIEFAAHFRKFARQKNRKRFKKLFADNPKQKLGVQRELTA